MSNRIVHTMHGAFEKLGFSVLRYNYRGVGRSQGRHDGYLGEIADAASALDWLQVANPKPSKVWVAGYSYGALISMQLLMRRRSLAGSAWHHLPTAMILGF